MGIPRKWDKYYINRGISNEDVKQPLFPWELQRKTAAIRGQSLDPTSCAASSGTFCIRSAAAVYPLAESADTSTADRGFAFHGPTALDSPNPNPNPNPNGLFSIATLMLDYIKIRIKLQNTKCSSRQKLKIH